jgi:hypothetical protein
VAAIVHVFSSMERRVEESYRISRKIGSAVGQYWYLTRSVEGSGTATM